MDILNPALAIHFITAITTPKRGVDGQRSDCCSTESLTNHNQHRVRVYPTKSFKKLTLVRFCIADLQQSQLARSLSNMIDMPVC
jgi:hypothetical protein